VLVVRQQPPQQPPELGRVVLELEVADLVRDDVVHERQRRHDHASVEAQRAAARATPPAFLLIADVDRQRVAEPFSEQGHALG
jgi:hypothetical protein